MTDRCGTRAKEEINDGGREVTSSLSGQLRNASSAPSYAQAAAGAWMRSPLRGLWDAPMSSSEVSIPFLTAQSQKLHMDDEEVRAGFGEVNKEQDVLGKRSKRAKMAKVTAAPSEKYAVTRNTAY